MVSRSVLVKLFIEHAKRKELERVHSNRAVLIFFSGVMCYHFISDYTLMEKKFNKKALTRSGNSDKGKVTRHSAKLRGCAYYNILIPLSATDKGEVNAKQCLVKPSKTGTFHNFVKNPILFNTFRL